MPSSARLHRFGSTLRKRAPMQLRSPQSIVKICQHIICLSLLSNAVFLCTSVWTRQVCLRAGRAVRAPVRRALTSAGRQISARHRKCSVTITGGVTGANNKDRQGWRNTTLATRYDELKHNMHVSAQFPRHLRLRKCSLNVKSFHSPGSASPS